MPRPTSTVTLGHLRRHPRAPTRGSTSDPRAGLSPAGRRAGASILRPDPDSPREPDRHDPRDSCRTPDRHRITAASPPLSPSRPLRRHPRPPPPSPSAHPPNVTLGPRPEGPRPIQAGLSPAGHRAAAPIIRADRKSPREPDRHAPGTPAERPIRRHSRRHPSPVARSYLSHERTSPAVPRFAGMHFHGPMDPPKVSLRRKG
jgi:hypothetical protein